MKTKEELEALKEKVNEVKKELRELSNEEMAQIIGGKSKNILDCIFVNVNMKNHPDQFTVSDSNHSFIVETAKINALQWKWLKDAEEATSNEILPLS